MSRSFLTGVSDRKGLISPERLASALHLQVAELARLVGVDGTTLVQAPDSPAIQEKLAQIAQVIATAADLSGRDLIAAVAWFRQQPLAGFAGETAAALRAKGRGDAVLAHLEMLRDGAFA